MSNPGGYYPPGLPPGYGYPPGFMPPQAGFMPPMGYPPQMQQPMMGYPPMGVRATTSTNVGFISAQRAAFCRVPF